MRAESRSNERQTMEPTVAWRRIRDSHWRMTGEWLDSIEPQEAPSSSGGLRVAEPVAKEESPELPWRPWENNKSNDGQDQGLKQIVSELQSSVGGSHKEYVARSIALDNCPSSNLHHFVLPVPHTSHEVFPSQDIRAKKSILTGKR